jgi:FkbM family methyltransferase
MNQLGTTTPLAEILGALPRVKVVDIGANPIDGAPPYASMLTRGDVDLVGFEPQPDALAKLQSLKGPNEIYLPHAIGDGRRHTLNVCLAPGMTSLLKPNRAVLELFHGFPSWGSIVETIEVDTIRLAEIPETAGMDWLKMDIQGAELMVLQNAGDRIDNALVAHVEVEFLPLYENQPLFSDVDSFMRSRGFVLHQFAPAVSRIIQPMVIGNDIYRGFSQLVWADAVFVRDITRLDLLDGPSLLKTAAVMHEVYGSYDLVLRLLQEHDRRFGSAHGGTYISSICVRPEAPRIAANG